MRRVLLVSSLVMTSTVTVSKDGKTLTLIQSGKDAQGAEQNSLAVYDRQ